MDKLFYPAIFHKADEGGFWITFPDIPECMTQGDDMQQAYDLVVEEGDLCVVIEFDLRAYQKRTNSKAVKKTLSIPEWLNEEAMEMGVNFSQVLQEALIQKLGAK